MVLINGLTLSCLEDEDEEPEEYYNSSTELGKAFKNKTLPHDIAEEIKKLEAADFIIFQVFCRL